MKIIYVWPERLKKKKGVKSWKRLGVFSSATRYFSVCIVMKKLKKKKKNANLISWKRLSNICLIK